MQDRKKSLNLLSGKLVSVQSDLLHRYKQRFVADTAKLDAMSPLKVLARGYSMAKTEDGKILRSVKQINPGDQFSLQVNDGTIDAVAVQLKENKA